MSKKIKEVTESIKTKLSFDDYTPSTHNDIYKSENKEVKTEQNNDSKVKKVKRTFYLDEQIVDRLDEFYVKKLSKKQKVDKSDIVAQALLNLLEDENAEVGYFP